jgi:hypothetical protein
MVGNRFVLSFSRNAQFAHAVPQGAGIDFQQMGCAARPINFAIAQ